MGKSTLSGPATVKEKLQNRRMIAEMRMFGTGKSSMKKMLRQTNYVYDAHSLVSWKTADQLHKNSPSMLPTLARGLFTSGDSGEEAIVSRGYDKFFNVGEVARATWQAITSDTCGPYEVTVKEDGCLILAAALDEGKKLLVTSKHAANLSHSQVGMKWMRHHLSLVNKTTDDFAAFLHENNATAAFELCDDGFEEHIMEYPELIRGLYLHGINRNTVELNTWPSSDVTKVAEEFGFIATQYFTFSTVEESKEFTDKVRKDQALDGRAIEGFVVRCKTVADNRPFMFKIKYDEPYLLFYEWQQTTNRILSGTPYKITFPLTRVYAIWVKEQLKTNPEDFAEYNNQKGVIGARKRFLAYYKANGGNETRMFDEAAGSKKILIMPVATRGCGKTTVSRALSKLFGFGHVKYDNIKAKNMPSSFCRAVLNEFDSHQFIIADGNNHTPDIRKKLRDSTVEELPGCRVIALYWDHDNASHDDILETTLARVVDSDEDSSTASRHKHKAHTTMRGIMAAFTSIDPESESEAAFDDVVELDPLAESSANIRTVVNRLCEVFPDELKRPSEKEIDAAIEEALAFDSKAQTTIRKQLAVAKLPSYIGLSPRTVNCAKWLEQQLKRNSNASWKVCQELKKRGQLFNASNIKLASLRTIEKPGNSDIYNEYVRLLGSSSRNTIKAECEADYIVCNSELMALRVKTMTVGKQVKVPSAVTHIRPSDNPETEATTEFISTYAVPHIALCVGPNANSGQIDEMLVDVFGPDNSNAPLNHPDGWAVIPVTLAFSAVLYKSKD
ncbi:trna ligase [Coemansia sp. RSA 1804]|nr:trna ligase [Coemansia sp. RSA 1804]